MEQSSIKILAPFHVRGAGGNMYARLAGKMELYLEDGKMLVIDPVYYIPDLPFNMISKGQLCDLPDYYSVTDNHGDGLAAWELSKTNLKGKKEGGFRWIVATARYTTESLYMLNGVNGNKDYVPTAGSAVAQVVDRRSLTVWHARFGHPDDKRVINSVREGLVSGIRSPTPTNLMHACHV
jgi:hypothetical protein